MVAVTRATGGPGGTAESQKHKLIILMILMIFRIVFVIFRSKTQTFPEETESYANDVNCDNQTLLNKEFRPDYIQIGDCAVFGSEGTLNFPGPAWFSAATLKM